MDENVDINAHNHGVVLVPQSYAEHLLRTEQSTSSISATNGGVVLIIPDAILVSYPSHFELVIHALAEAGVIPTEQANSLLKAVPDDVENPEDLKSPGSKGPG